METESKTEQPAPKAEPAPIQSQPAAQPAPTPVVIQKNSNPWPWIVGGCLMIVILVIATFLILSWWGFKMVKQGIQESDTAKSINNGIEKLNKEEDEWQKKSEEFRDSMPDPEELQNSIPQTPSTKYKK